MALILDLQLSSGLSEIARVDETGEFGGIFLNASFEFDENYDCFLITHKDWLYIAGELAREMGMLEDHLAFIPLSNDQVDPHRKYARR